MRDPRVPHRHDAALAFLRAATLIGTFVLLILERLRIL